MNRFLASLLAMILPIGLMRFGVEDGGGGGSTPPAAPPAPPATPPADPDAGRTSFSLEYVKELREEAKASRLRAQALEQEGATHKTAAEKAAADAAAAVAAATSAANDRILRSELKAIALKAGMIDLDGLKLADLSGVKLKDDGTIDGADAMLEALKKSKPYLFGAGQSSSPPGTPPSSKPPAAKLAKDMTPEEYKAARKQFK